METNSCLPCVISVMTVGSVRLLYNISWKCRQLAAEQLLPGQTEWSSRAGGTVRTIHHSTNHSCRATLSQPSKAGHSAGLARPNDNASFLCVILTPSSFSLLKGVKKIKVGIGTFLCGTELGCKSPGV
jgi:hypothetical protein